MGLINKATNYLLVGLRLLEIPAVLMILVAFLAVKGSDRNSHHDLSKAVNAISIIGFGGVIYFLLIEGLFSLIKRYKERKETRKRNSRIEQVRNLSMVNKQRVLDIIHPYWLEAMKKGTLHYTQVCDMQNKIEQLWNR